MTAEQDNAALTANERAWLRFLRDISDDRDPEPTLQAVQLLRRVCKRRPRTRKS